MASSPPPPTLPVGEASWIDYIDQQRRHANNLEKRVHTVELYRSAANAEPGSLKIWLAYCDYFWSLYDECGQHSPAHWSRDEQATGRDFFSLNAALHLWGEGHEATTYRLGDSHELWDRWIGLEKELLDRTRTADGVKRITHLYRNRLQTPHATWDSTAQSFSTFLSEYNSAGYEGTMKDVTNHAKEAKAIYAARESKELQMHDAAKSGSADAHRAAMWDYLNWEVANSKRERKNHALALRVCLGLFSRALTGALASDEVAWTEYIVYLAHMRTTFGEGRHKDDEALRLLPNPLDILQRAVQHCPWSGPLWARYILSGEEAGLSFFDMERIKHAATRSSQLDRDGMTAVVEVYTTWCGYLKRTAMHPNATDEAVDIADSGLVAALEAVQTWGERRFGKEYQGDPNFRLERILIQYLTEKHTAIDEARDQWKKLADKPLYANSYDFWLHYFLWEMVVFQFQKNHDNSPAPGAAVKGVRVPTLAARVLERAMRNHDLDWPERVIEVYLHHCNEYQTSETLCRALDTIHRVKKGIAKRREQEAAAQYAILAVAAEQGREQDSQESPSGSKRKRESTADDAPESASKRAKNEPVNGGGSVTVRQDERESQNLKRDRENTSVFVTNLPAEITKTKVKSYFREYGHIVDIHLEKEKDGHSSIAFVEFGSPEEMQSARLRDEKYFGDQRISVKPATNLTVYVTNFPPVADDPYIRDLFKDCGEIFSTRWPNLRYNTQRRFCYVTFRDTAASATATGLDGKILDGKFKLIAKYSDPGRRKDRSGPLAEGRQVHVKSLDYSIDEAALEEVFAKYGEVSGARILRKQDGTSRGSAFVDFKAKEDAEKAVAELDKVKLGTKIMVVELAVDSNFRPTARITGAASPSPAPSGKDANGDETTAAGDLAPADSIRARKFALLGIPATVSAARLQALVEQHGEIVKLVLREEHAGALVELSDAAAAGKAQLALEGVEIDGQKLRVGAVAELFREKADKKPSHMNKHAGAKPSKSLMAPPLRVHRPALGKGPKRGLGFVAKAADGTMTNGQAEAKTNGTVETEHKVEKKSNADFRNMFLAAKASE